ncbi:MAG: DUF5009 domain-containing protein [Bacteroidales bacterium]|nr:DUF5009 domain-containing protein [Bacteroidales bacterium]
MSYLEKRNAAIDLLRALTMAVMIVVNDFWSVSGIPHWMGHAAASEDMLGFSDIVFPTFLFCVGLSIPYAITAMRRKGRSEGDVIRHILSRSFALILMGAFICNYEQGIDPAIGYNRNIYCLLMATAFFLIYNRYQQSGWLVRCLKGLGWAILLFLLITSRSPEGRTFYPYWWGILGLIGWAYLFCALVYALSKTVKVQVLVWFLLFAICLFCTRTSPDSQFAGKPILALSTPNIVDLTLSILQIGNASSHLLVMSGVLFSGIFLKRTELYTNSRQATSTLVLAIACLIVAIVSHRLFITSKIIGTLPWIFYTLAIGLFLYALLDVLVAKGKAGWLNAIRPAGTATLTCYLVPYFLYPLISLSIGWAWSYGIPEPFGIVKCILFSALCIAITWLLGKLSICLKV